MHTAVERVHSAPLMTGIKSRSQLLPPTGQKLGPRERGGHVNVPKSQHSIPYPSGNDLCKTHFFRLEGGEDPLTDFASCWGRQAKKAETQRGEAEP